MYSDNEKVVLCGASAYEQKYYFNQDFASLPQSVQDELHVMCVMFTVEIGGIFTMWFDSDGSLAFETEAVDADAMYDEIGGALRIKQYQEEKKELLESLELYYRVFFLGEEVPEEALMEEDGEKQNGKEETYTAKDAATENRKRGDAEPTRACTDGGGDGSAVSCSVQGAGRGPDLYGNGECEGNFI